MRKAAILALSLILAGCAAVQPPSPSPTVAATPEPAVSAAPTPEPTASPDASFGRPITTDLAPLDIRPVPCVLTAPCVDQTALLAPHSRWIGKFSDIEISGGPNYGIHERSVFFYLLAPPLFANHMTISLWMGDDGPRGVPDYNEEWLDSDNKGNPVDYAAFPVSLPSAPCSSFPLTIRWEMHGSYPAGTVKNLGANGQFQTYHYPAGNMASKGSLTLAACPGLESAGGASPSPAGSLGPAADAPSPTPEPQEGSPAVAQAPDLPLIAFLLFMGCAAAVFGFARSHQPKARR